MFSFFALQTSGTYSFVGPGHYNIFNTGMAQESLKKAYLESTRNGPFGTTSARIMPILQKHDVALPGPSHYQVSRMMNNNYYSNQIFITLAVLRRRLRSEGTISAT